jgi:hypothetical protein
MTRMASLDKSGRLARRWAEERATARALGWWWSLVYAIHRALLKISAGRIRLICYALVVQPVAPPTVPARPRTSRIAVRELTADDPMLVRIPRQLSVMQGRFARNGRAIGAFTDDDSFAGMIWFQLDDYDEDEVRCRYRFLPRGRVCWDYDMLIEEALRVTPLFTRIWTAATTMLHGLGIEWTASRISSFNAPSLRSHARLGAKRVGTVTFLCFGPVQLLVGTCRPYIHLSVGKSAPVIDVDARAAKGSP